MSETRDLVREAAERLFEKHCSAETMRRADGGEFPQALWRALSDAGYAAALVPESAGGAGLEMSDALSLLISAGRHAVPAPLAETMLAGWLLSARRPCQCPKDPSRWRRCAKGGRCPDREARRRALAHRGNGDAAFPGRASAARLRSSQMRTEEASSRSYPLPTV